MKILVAIPSYNRPALLLCLLKQIKEQFTCEYEVRIYDDCSLMDYTPIREFAKENKQFIYWRSDLNHGKKLFWKLHQKMYGDLKDADFDYFIQISDDYRLVDDFFVKIIDYLLASGAGLLRFTNSRLYDKVVKGRKVEIVTINGVQYYDYQWTDCAYVTTKGFFEKINYTVPSLSSSIWKKNPKASSRIGCVLTGLCNKHNIKIMGLVKSLVLHLGFRSTMKPYCSLRDPKKEMEFYD